MTRTETGLLVLVIVGAIGLTLSGCGASALERHTMAAGLLHAATGEAAALIEHGAQVDADAATDVADLEARMVRWHRAEAAQHVAAEAVDSYVAELLAAALRAAEDDSKPDLSTAMASLSRALSLYREVAALVAEYGIELPGVGRVLAIIGGE